MSKKLSLSAALGVVMLSLVGCTAATTEAAAPECTPTASGASSEKIDVTGEAGAAPTVKFPSPLAAKKTERSVVTDGDGNQAVVGSSVSVNYTAFNGSTGDEVDSTSYEKDGEATFTLDEQQLLPGLLKALECSAAGARVAVVIPPGDAFGAEGASQLKIGPTDTLVFVLDVLAVSKPVKVLDRADGKDQELPADFPKIGVALDDDGVPTVTLPDGEPPAELELAVLKKGDGAEVGAGADVTVNYQGQIWASKTVFDDSWAKGAPVPFNTGGVIPGFTQALEGQTVGSQVLVVIPPDLGYGPGGGQPSAGISATDTLVFIIDILATQ